MARFKNKENLDKAMDKKWKALCDLNLRYGMEWLQRSEKIINWYDENLSALVGKK